MTMKAWELGAMLFTPCTIVDLLSVANGVKYPNARSIILDTEDSVAEWDVEKAVRNLQAVMPGMTRTTNSPQRFVRVRNPEIASVIAGSEGIENIDGFVFPKFTQKNFDAYMRSVRTRDHLQVLPILETAEIFEDAECVAIRQELMPARIRERILALLIGGNDLMNCLDIRRSPDCTIYETPIGTVISRLVGLFKPYGFHLVACVFEGLNHDDTLRREVELDLQHGLTCKMAIHPQQLSLVQGLYKVSPADKEMADAILDPHARAVFSMHNTMCEPATHKRWAHNVQARANIYGVADVRLHGEERPRRIA